MPVDRLVSKDYATRVRTTIDGMDVCLSVPSVVGRAGVVATMPLVINDSERFGLSAGAAALRAVIDQVRPPNP